jgi:hypothetical protein
MQAHMQTYVHKGGYTPVPLPRTVTPYRDSEDGTRDHVTYQKFMLKGSESTLFCWYQIYT